jgi:hypothetical protein
MKKTIQNESGNILIRQSVQHGCGIVEMMHLFDNNESGCVIGYWEKVTVDGEYSAEFRSVHDRIMDTKYDSADILLNSLIFGQKLANLIIETKEEKIV